MQILNLIRDRFEQALSGMVANPAIHAQRVTTARDPQHGDYQANIAMPLAKELQRKPQEIAADLVAKLQIEDICHPPEIAGPGFINLKLKDDFLASQLLTLAGDERVGVGQVTPKSYVLDYSAPNVAKPMHVGHIRSTVIGDALYRILKFLGHNVVSDNHLGDWGTQFGMIIYGYKNFVDSEAYDQDEVAELIRLYRMVQQLIGYQSAEPKLAGAIQKVGEAAERLNAAEALPSEDKSRKKAVKAAEKDLRSANESLKGLQAKIDSVQSDPVLMEINASHPGIEQRAQQETVKLHESDPENLELWNKFLPISIELISSVYERLGIKFDFTYGESFYHPMLDGVVRRLIESGMAIESDGAICIFLDGFDAPMIIRKRDGAFLYATTDLATIDYRMEHFKPDAILYVVDHRQSDHFAKLFAAARAIGYDHVELNHISFGTVLGSDGKPFKTRSGTVVGLGYLLDEAVERARQVVCDPERMQRAGIDMDDAEIKAIANAVGLGAIKYADLSHNRTSDYEFNTEKMVQLEGNTSTYIQYMYARSRSILRKSELDVTADSASRIELRLEQPAERNLVLQLLQFEDALHATVEEYYPSILTAYLFGLAKQFATFFDQCHVLNADSEDLKKSRLAICFVAGLVLKQGLELLGIDVVERM